MSSLPTQKGTALYPQTIKQPTVVRIDGVDRGSPLAYAIVNTFLGELNRFRAAQQQQYELSVVGVQRGYASVEGLDMMYTNINGQEIINMKVAPEIIEKLRRRKKVREAIIYLNFIDDVYTILGETQQFPNIFSGLGAVDISYIAQTATRETKGLVGHGVPSNFTGSYPWIEGEHPIAVGRLYDVWSSLFTDDAYKGGIVVVVGATGQGEPSGGGSDQAAIAPIQSKELILEAVSNPGEENVRVARGVQIPDLPQGAITYDILQRYAVDLPLSVNGAAAFIDKVQIAMRYVPDQRVAVAAKGLDVRRSDAPVHLSQLYEYATTVSHTHWFGMALPVVGDYNFVKWMAVYHAEDVLEWELPHLSDVETVPWLRDEQFDPIPDVGRGIQDVVR